MSNLNSVTASAVIQSSTQTVEDIINATLSTEASTQETAEQEVVVYVPEGRIALNGNLSGSILSTKVTEDYSYISGTYSGSINEGIESGSAAWISGSNFILSSSITGLVSSINVGQQISGSYNILVSGSVNLYESAVSFSGTGNVILYGNISGSLGNVVEGKDRPFFSVQKFSGSIFSKDTLDTAIFNINLADMNVVSLGFVAGGVVLNSASVSSYSTDSSGAFVGDVRKIPRQVWIKSTLTVPGIGDICYTDGHASSRVVSSKVYSVDLDQVLCIDNFGVVVQKISRPVLDTGSNNVNILVDPEKIAVYTNRLLNQISGSSSKAAVLSPEIFITS